MKRTVVRAFCAFARARCQPSPCPHTTLPTFSALLPTLSPTIPSFYPHMHACGMAFSLWLFLHEKGILGKTKAGRTGILCMILWRAAWTDRRKKAWDGSFGVLGAQNNNMPVAQKKKTSLQHAVSVLFYYSTSFCTPPHPTALYISKRPVCALQFLPSLRFYSAAYMCACSPSTYSLSSTAIPLILKVLTFSVLGMGSVPVSHPFSSAPAIFSLSCQHALPSFLPLPPLFPAICQLSLASVSKMPSLLLSWLAAS